MLLSRLRTTVRFRISLGVAAGLSLSVALLLGVAYFSLTGMFRDEARQRLAQVVPISAGVIGQAGGSLIHDPSVPTSIAEDGVLDKVAQITGAIIDVYLRGVLTATSRRAQIGDPGMAWKEEASKVAYATLMANPTSFFRQETIGGDVWYVHYEPIRDAKGGFVGMFVAYGPKVNFDSWAVRITKNLALISLPLTCLLVIALWISLAKTFQRFESVRSALLALADRRLDVQVPELAATDEIGAMAGAAQRYKESSLHLAELEKERADLLAQEVKRRNEALYLAEHDTLTGLANRRGLAAALNGAFGSGEAFGLLLLDLDNFKEINDTQGHAVGDELLRAVADRLRTQVPSDALVARLGGDEFAVILPKADASVRADRANHLIAAIAEPYCIANNWLRVGVSIGSAGAPADASDADNLLANADIAMYRAKAAGRLVHRAYDPSHREEMLARSIMLERLREALKNEDLKVHYQPKIAMATGQVAGAEALVRWTVEGIGNIPPDRFIPLAEQFGLIGELGRQVLRRSCFDAAGWARETGRPIPVAVNLSAHQLRDPDLVDMVSGILAESGLPASLLELEITESAVMEDVETVILTFARLTALGLSLSIDDFGTGYSSLSYLRRFRVAKMKIDRSFVVDLETSADARAVAASIVGLGRGLGLKIVAEGIEDQQQFAQLAGLGCDEGQGWLFSKALPLEAFTAFLTRAEAHPGT